VRSSETLAGVGVEELVEGDCSRGASKGRREEQEAQKTRARRRRKEWTEKSVSRRGEEKRGRTRRTVITEVRVFVEDLAATVASAVALREREKKRVSSRSK
jgi:hypothetical protein